MREAGLPKGNLLFLEVKLKYNSINYGGLYFGQH